MKQITPSSLVKMVLLSIVFSIFHTAQGLSPAREESTDIRGFIGTWVNIDNKTAGIKKVIISKAGLPKIQVFGACAPKACDWGIQSAKAYSYFSRSASSMAATYTSSFSVKELSLQVAGEKQTKRLLIIYSTRFTDGSGRKGYSREATFKQVLTKAVPNKRTVVKKQPKTIRLTPAQIRAKRLAEWYKANPDKKPRTKKVVKPRPRPISLRSINQKFPSRCGFGGFYYGKVKYHKGNKVYYLAVKDRFTQDYSEKFELTQFTSPKSLNQYVVLYGAPLVGGRVKPDFNGAISGKVLQVVHNHRVDYKKLKVWCAKL